jgi:hypothetical protein
MSVVALDDSPPAGDCEFRGKQTLQAPLPDAAAADRQSHGAAIIVGITVLAAQHYMFFC